MTTVEAATIAMIVATETINTEEEDVTIDVEDTKTATTHHQLAAPLHGSRLLQLHQHLMADMAAMVLLNPTEFRRLHLLQWVLLLGWPLRQDSMLFLPSSLVPLDPLLRRRRLPTELHRPHQAISRHHLRHPIKCTAS